MPGQPAVSGETHPGLSRRASRALGSAAERRPRDLSGWLYVAPSLLVNGLFLLFPVLATLLMALTSWNGLEPPQWVGAANFQELFASQSFWGAAINNVK